MCDRPCLHSLVHHIGKSGDWDRDMLSFNIPFQLLYFQSRSDFKDSIVCYRLRQQKWPIIFTGFWGIYTDLWTPAHILFDCPWSHDSKMGWTISVGQNKLELDQFLARKFIMKIIEIENIFICPYIDDLATSFQIALILNCFNLQICCTPFWNPQKQ